MASRVETPMFSWAATKFLRLPQVSTVVHLFFRTRRKVTLHLVLRCWRGVLRSSKHHLAIVSALFPLHSVIVPVQRQNGATHRPRSQMKLPVAPRGNTPPLTNSRRILEGVNVDGGFAVHFRV